jgi:predicted solute-binding protein
VEPMIEDRDQRIKIGDEALKRVHSDKPLGMKREA